MGRAELERGRIALADGITDEALVAAVRAGSKGAFGVLYARYHGRIQSYVAGILHTPERAEDVTQEAFIAALRRMRVTDSPIAFKPWIYEIAKNASIDQLRRNSRAELVAYDGDRDDGLRERERVGTNGRTPDEAVDAKLRFEDLVGAFNGLSEVQHRVLVMRELEGRTYAEIGERLGLTRPSVESALFRARRRLSAEYAEISSGRRCRRIVAILTDARESGLGSREQNRVARHIAHCRGCRIEAQQLGFDAAALVRRPRRGLAALLPLPFLRLPRVGDGGVFDSIRGALTNWSASSGAGAAEIAGAGAGKTMAIVATCVVAGAAAGTTTLQQRGDGRGDRNAAAMMQSPDRGGVGAARVSPLVSGGFPAAGSSGQGSGAAGSDRGRGGAAARDGNGRAPASDGATAAAPIALAVPAAPGDTQPAAGQSGDTRGHRGGGGGDNATQRSTAPGKGDKPSASKPVPDVAGAVGETIEDVGDAVGEAVEDTARAVEDKVGKDAADDAIGRGSGGSAGGGGGNSGGGGSGRGSDGGSGNGGGSKSGHLLSPVLDAL